MLKNIHPLLSGSPLTMIDAMKPGEWLILASQDFRSGSPDSTVIYMGEVTMEAAATAILSIMPLDAYGTDPLVFLDIDAEIDADADPADIDTEGNRLPDVAFAVRGIAADAERRRVKMSTLPPDEFAERAAHAAVTVRTAQSGQVAFLLRKGALA